MLNTTHASVHDPDGVPHQIVGLTWVFAFGAAICAFLALTFGGIVSGLALLAVPTIVVALAKRAHTKRATRRLHSGDLLFRQ